MKKVFLLIALFAIVTSAVAQLKTITNGNVGVGITSNTLQMKLL